MYGLPHKCGSLTTFLSCFTSSTRGELRLVSPMAYRIVNCVSVSVIESETVGDVLYKFTQQTEEWEVEFQIFFGGILLESHKSLSEYGIESGDLHLLPQRNPCNEARLHRDHARVSRRSAPADSSRLATLVAVPDRAVDRKKSGVYDAIWVVSKMNPPYPDIRFHTIYFSNVSHPFRGKQRSYAGFILYAWEDDNGDVKIEWRLNGRRCKSAYFVIQDTDSADAGVKRYIGRAPGQVHGAVYWNVFGVGADVTKAVGEGFAFRNGNLEWKSYTFNANPDAYHDNMRVISDLAKICVEKIINDWKKRQTSKEYRVENLL